MWYNQFVVETIYGDTTMRVTKNVTKKGTSFYIIRSISGGSTEIVEKLGTEKEIKDKYHCEDAYEWAKKRASELTIQEKESQTKVMIPLRPFVPIPPGERMSFNIGYLFLQQLYYDLRIPSICREISKHHAFEYDLNEIFSRLVYGRILFPSSKLSTLKQSADLFEPSSFEYHQLARALSVLAEGSDLIQEKLYRFSAAITPRETGVLYYDCTNFYFEIEQEKGIRKYGHSKEHRPNPIVQMGLFMDYSGLPLAMCITDGNANEQTTLLPLEQKILRDFGTSRFVVCTDAGLSSEESRKFNNFGERSFVTTQSIKKMKKERKEWCLDPEGWHVPGSSETFSIDGICANDVLRAKHYETIFYKEAYIEGYDEQRDIEFNQTLIVTFSLKYRDYLKSIRDGQIERARSLIRQGISKIDRRGQQDPRRFITRTSKTSEGKTASKTSFAINEEIISEESAYDGFYAVCTNLDDDISDILHVVKSRWEIEESFRIMKSEFSARPVYLQRDDRIKAHFITCFTALLIYRLLEKKLGGGFTCSQIITTLRSMRVTKAGDKGYLPSYMRTELTDALHDTAGFRTDYEILRKKYMQGVVRRSKNL